MRILFDIVAEFLGWLAEVADRDRVRRAARRVEDERVAGDAEWEPSWAISERSALLLGVFIIAAVGLLMGIEMESRITKLVSGTCALLVVSTALARLRERFGHRRPPAD